MEPLSSTLCHNPVRWRLFAWDQGSQLHGGPAPGHALPSLILSALLHLAGISLTLAYLGFCPHCATTSIQSRRMGFQARSLASKGFLRDTLQTDQGVHRGLQNQPFLFVRNPAKKWFRHLGGGGSIVPFCRRAETQQLAIASTWFSLFVMETISRRTLILSCLASARGKSNPTSCNSSMERLSGCLRIKGRRSPLQPQLGKHITHSPRAELPEQNPRTTPDEMQTGGAQTESGNTSPGPSNQCLPLLGRAGGHHRLRSRIDQDLCHLPVLSSHRQKVVECASVRYYRRFFTIRLSLLRRVGYADLSMAGLTGNSAI